MSQLPLPASASHTASGSIAGAAQVAKAAPASVGHAVVDAARQSFVLGMHRGVLVGAAVAIGASLIALVWLPARAPESADDGIVLDEPNVFGLLPGDDAALLEEVTV
jgi:hypothetical protein